MGEAASDALETLAETGNPDPLLLSLNPYDFSSAPDFLGPGEIVVTDWLDALMALQGGAGSSEEMDEEAEPMEIICYQLD